MEPTLQELLQRDNPYRFAIIQDTKDWSVIAVLDIEHLSYDEVMQLVTFFDSHALGVTLDTHYDFENKR